MAKWAQVGNFMQSVCDNPAISCEETDRITHLLLHRDAHSERGQNLTDHVSMNQDTDAAGRRFSCRTTDVTSRTRLGRAVQSQGWKVVGVLHASMTTYTPLITDKPQRSRHRYTNSQICVGCLDVAILCLKSANCDCCQETCRRRWRVAADC